MRRPIGEDHPRGRLFVYLRGHTSYTFDFDPNHRILRCRFEGQVTDDEFRRYLQVTWSYVARIGQVGSITDLSGVTSWEVTLETLKAVAHMPSVLPPFRKRRIVLATSQRIFEMMRSFEREAELTYPNLHVVRSWNEARAILGVKEFHFKPIPEARPY